MKIRIYNARVLAMDGDFKVTEGELHTENERIIYVGEGLADISEGGFDREIDAKGNLILPGFKNAHTHSGMTFLRSYADDLPLMDWLNNQVFPMEAKLTGAAVYWFSKLAFMEYLTSGITADFDMYFYQEDMARASVETGFRTVMTSGMSNFMSSVSEQREDYIKFNDYHPLISYKLGFHAEYTNSVGNLEGIAKLADEFKAPVFTHNSETAGEVRGCIERYGKTPTALMESLGLFEYGGGGYHCVHMSDEDIDIFKRRGLTMVTNPGSNMKLASGTPGISEFLKAGVRVALGTDGPASNNCLDMFREMFLVTGLAKLRERKASAVPAEEVLKMACVNGAICMGLKDCDCLRAGKLADLIMLDLNKPNMQPINNIVRNIVYSGSKQNVIMTMINGKILYENGRVDIGEEPERIYKEVNARVAMMKG